MDHSNDTSYSRNRRSHEISQSLKSISKELSKFEDSTEDFQFKPLTQGLGFQKKSLNKDLETSTAVPALEIHEALTPSRSALKLSKENFVETPTQKIPTPNPTSNGTSEKVEDILKNLRNRRLNFEETLKFPQPPTKQKNREPIFFKSSFDFSAGLLDTMLVLSLCLTALISLILVAKIDLFQNLMNPDNSGAVYIGLLGIVAAFSFVYLVATRAFLGCSAGEWIFEQQLGTKEDQSTNRYILKVALRSVVVIASGFFLLPLISLLVNQDLSGRLTGLQLIKKS
jgi:hypothetical protein